MDQKCWEKLLDIKKKGYRNVTEELQPCDEKSSIIKEYLTVLQAQKAEGPRPLIYAHLAQSIDGRIACNNGDSKWIGNNGNLIHAHRMRALCDAVMVGHQTWENDQPQLNVRHVEGDNPIRIRISGHSMNRNDHPKTFELDGEDSVKGNWNNLSELLETFYQRGIKSIYLEGGGKTISYFLSCGLVDHFQLHISPMVIGSGISSIDLPVIHTLKDAITFDDPAFIPIDDHIMFSGRVIYHGS